MLNKVYHKEKTAVYITDKNLFMYLCTLFNKHPFFRFSVYVQTCYNFIICLDCILTLLYSKELLFRT